MNLQDSSSHELWLKKRKKTTIAFSIQNIFLGFDMGIFFINLWIYEETLVKTNHRKLYYGAIMSLYLFSASVFTAFICQIADKYRNVRTSFFLTNAALIGGNLVYMVPFSPWYLLLGRIITSIGLSQRPIITGEIARCYKHEELTSKLALMSISFKVGFLIAPVANAAFQSVNFWLGSLHITFANLSGLYMAVIFTIAQVTCQFMVHDLSKEFDLKDHMETKKGNIENNDDSYCFTNDDTTNDDTTNGANAGDVTIASAPLRSSEKRTSIAWLFKEMLSHYDTCLLLGISFVENFFIGCAMMTLPIIIVDILKWPVSALNGIRIGEAAFSMLPFFILMCKTITDSQVYYMSVISIFGYIFLQLYQIVLVAYSRDNIINVVLSVVYSVVDSTSVLVKDIFLGGFLAKMISSKYQSLGDGIRLSVSRLGGVAAYLSSPFALERIEIIGWVYICIMLLFGILLARRINTLRNPKIIIN